MTNPANKTDNAIGEIRDAILQRQRFLLTSHARPDGDAVGSQLAMAYALAALGKTVRCVDKDPAPPALMAFPGVADDKKRAAIIAFLRANADTPAPLPEAAAGGEAKPEEKATEAPAAEEAAPPAEGAAPPAEEAAPPAEEAAPPAEEAAPPAENR
jgi:hypothetical protein